MEMKKMIRDLPWVLIGNFMLALAVAMFILPYNILSGGVAGIAVALEPLFHIDPTMMVNALVLGMFVLGTVFLGKSFAVKTVISSLIYPVYLTVITRFVPILELDPMLASLYGGLIGGLGIGMVLRTGASTGGMDIPPLILNKKFRIPVALSMYFFDIFILLSQMIFSNTEEILYGIMSVLLTSIVLNQVLVFGAGDVQVLIISREYERINEIIQTDLDRGSTFLPIQTGFEKLDQKAVLCVLPNREMSHLNHCVQEIDPKAFIIINGVREVRGRGFTLDKHLV